MEPVFAQLLFVKSISRNEKTIISLSKHPLIAIPLPRISSQVKPREKKL